MSEGITMLFPKKVDQVGKNYFDEYLYAELKSFLSPDNGHIHSLPSFSDVVEKINSFKLRSELKLLIVRDTLTVLLEDLSPQRGLPPFIVSYICSEALVRAVLKKFSTALGFACSDIGTLSNRIGDNTAEAANVFFSLKICDPSARSGQFLQAMLNEMIVLMSQLNILNDAEGNPLHPYRFTFSNGQMAAFSKRDFRKIDLLERSDESEAINKALFYNKRELLINSIFGTDPDALSVLICDLRLWSDLISHLDFSNNSDFPPIEANVLCGDALISRFSTDEDLATALKTINQTVSEYKKISVKTKTTGNRTEKEYFEKFLSIIKKRLVDAFGWKMKDTTEMLKLQHELAEIMSPTLFSLSDKELQQREERISYINTQIKKKEKQLEEFRNNPAFEQAIEWRYDFPESIDGQGNFLGFDAMVGTPPDALIAGLGDERATLYKNLNYRIFKRTGNIADLYCELANKLLVHGGTAAYVFPSQWRRDTDSSRFGKYITAEMNPLLLLEFPKIQDKYPPLQDKCAFIVSRDINHHQAHTCELESYYDPQVAELSDYITQYAVPLQEFGQQEERTTEPSLVTIVTSSVEYMSIKGKIQKSGLPIKNWDVKIYSGIMTGYDKAFIINAEMREKFILEDYKNADIIKPLLTSASIKHYGNEGSDKWLIYVPWHFPLHYDMSITSASERAEQAFRQQYPGIYNHLLEYKNELSSRNAIEIGLGFEWYALQRSGMNNNWNDFEEQKVVWKRDLLDFRFGIDYAGCAVLNDTCYIIGQHIRFLLGVFNSTMGKFMLTDQSRLLANDTQGGISLVESLHVPRPASKLEAEVIKLVNKRIVNKNKSETELSDLDEAIDQLIYDLYGLTIEEKEFVKAQFPVKKL